MKNFEGATIPASSSSQKCQLSEVPRNRKANIHSCKTPVYTKISNMPLKSFHKSWYLAFYSRNVIPSYIIHYQYFLFKHLIVTIKLSFVILSPCVTAELCSPNQYKCKTVFGLFFFVKPFPKELNSTDWDAHLNFSMPLTRKYFASAGSFRIVYAGWATTSHAEMYHPGS